MHRTHGQVIAVRAAPDRAALLPLPDRPYLVTDKHLRRVGKDCLVSFEASFYSVPAKQIRAGQQVQLAVDGETVTIRALGADGGGWFTTPPPSPGAWLLGDRPCHWDGLPDGHSRAVVVDPAQPSPRRTGSAAGEPNPLAALLATHHTAGIPVARRPLTDYHIAAQATAPTTIQNAADLSGEELTMTHQAAPPGHDGVDQQAGRLRPDHRSCLRLIKTEVEVENALTFLDLVAPDPHQRRQLGIVCADPRSSSTTSRVFSLPAICTAVAPEAVFTLRRNTTAEP